MHKTLNVKFLVQLNGNIISNYLIIITERPDCLISYHVTL